jgi:hypothetical protein
MKRWQLLVIVLLLVTSAWGIISHPPGSRVVQQASLRTPSPSLTPDVRPITLLFVGDIMLSRSVGDTMSASGDWEWPFARVASTTAAADLAFANLETTISTGGAKNGCGYCFRADPKSVSGLESIKASIYPKKSSYLYYLHDKGGNIHYAKTFAEHRSNILKYLK